MKNVGDARDNEVVFTRRTVLLGAGAGIGFLVLAGRLYSIQINQAADYTTQSEANQFRYDLLTPNRGRILDRFGEALAENKENYSVEIVPEAAGDPEAVLTRLTEILPLTQEAKEVVLEEIERTRDFNAVTVIENLQWREFAQVNLHAPELPGVTPVVGETRFYPHGEAFAHITGYVGKADPETAGNDRLLNDPTFRIGREGLEKTLDQRLRGAAGQLKVEVDVHGRIVRELPDPAMAARAGADVRLTLDAGLQQRAIKAISVEQAASATVIDVRTGDILALVSYPAFDPNHFARRMSNAEYSALRDDERQPLFQKAFAGGYSPGSTFKPVVSMAVQHFGAANPAETVYCSGSIPLGRGRKHCWKAHGSMDLQGAIKNSCDIYFYEMARRLGPDKIAEMAHAFGLGDAPAIGLPGVRAGLIPTEAWKRANYDEAWTVGDSMNIGIGQGFVNVTPLQLAIMTARVATGLNVIPRLVLDGPAPEFAPLPYPAEFYAAVRGGMRAVCQEPGGTAYYYLDGKGLNFGEMEMAGKSGSAQVVAITAAERAAGRVDSALRPYHLRDNALFIGYAPFDNPRYACAVVVEHGVGGSRVVAPMVRDILVHALDNNSGRDPNANFAALAR